MSEGDALDGSDSDTQILTAEYRDGQLQILNMPSLHGDEGSSESNCRYMQVLDPEKGLVQLNLTLVRCEGEEGDSSYRLVTSGECEGEEDSSPVTCVLQDGDEDVSYVMVDSDQDLIMLDSGSEQAETCQTTSYQPDNLVTNETGTYEQVSSVPSHPAPVTSQSELILPDRVRAPDKVKPVGPDRAKAKVPRLSPDELLRRAQLVRQLKIRAASQPVYRVGRKRRNLPPPHELLASPNFRLFLYSCKQCMYKCNAIKELTAHRIQEHGNCKSKDSGFQCARCPYRAPLPHQLTKHMEDKHWDHSRLPIGKMITLDSKEVEEADVLVCGACGFECAERDAFRTHITENYM